MASTDQVPQGNVEISPPVACMESVNRIVKLPVVEQTLQTAQNIYGKVKDYNSVTNWTLQTAENTAQMAYDVTKPYATPVIKNFEGPIKKVDDVLCSGLDYVETKVPAVKMPPMELILQIYNATKEYYNTHVTPAVETAVSYAEPAVKTARSVVEPYVEPIVESVKHRVDEYLNRNQESAESQETDEEKEKHKEKQ